MHKIITILIFVLLAAYICLLIYGKKRANDYKYNALTQFTQAVIWALLAYNTWEEYSTASHVVLCAVALISLGNAIALMWKHR